MFQLTINEKGGSTRTETFDKDEVTIGRVQGNDVILPKGNISKRHSRIVLKDGKFIIVDLKSTNGTYVNGKKITAPQVIKSSDKVYIGDFTLQIENGAEAAAAEDEIDLFGGNAPMLDPPGGPGLIDDNFDQEFGAGPEAAPAYDPMSAPPEPELQPLSEPVPDARLEPPEPLSAPAPDPDPAPAFDPFPDASSPLSSTRAPEPVDAPEASETGDVGGWEPLAPDALAPMEEPEPEPEPEPELHPSEAPSPRSRRGAPRSSPSRVRPIPGAASSAPASRPAVEPPLAAEPPAAGAPATAALGEPLELADAEDAVLRQVIQELDLRTVPASQLPAHRPIAHEAAHRCANRLLKSGRLVAGDVEPLAARVAYLATDLSPLADWLDDDACVEVVVTPDRQVMVDREGQLEAVGAPIASEGRMADLLRQLAAYGGADVDDGTVDVRLSGGARVVGLLPPLGFRGPSLTIRKPTRDYFTLQKLLEYSTLSPGMSSFLSVCISTRTNLLLSCGPGATPTATLNALLGQIPGDERVATLEYGVELWAEPDRMVVHIHPDDFTPAEQVVQAVRSLQVDRMVVSDVDGPQGPGVLRAAGGPLAGSILAVSAADPEEAVRVVAAHEERGPASVARALPIVVHEARFSDNSRRLTRIGEVCEDGEGGLRVEDIFSFQPEGVDDQNIVVGRFQATGHVPRFLTELVERGEVRVDMSIFEG
jgi:pilus assembly protein CpaF